MTESPRPLRSENQGANAPRSPLVSTIIPVFNRPVLLREAVASVLAQTYRPIEIVIVDDGSADETPRVGDELVREHPGEVVFLRQANAGPGVARETGRKSARGELIQYLDSDDLLQPRKFELQVAALRENPDADVCYCVTLRRDVRTGESKVWKRTGDRIERIFPEFLMERGWATLTPLWRRSVCDQVGPWGDFRVMEDWEHDLRAGMLGVKTVHVDVPLAVVQDHAGDRASGMTTGFTPALTREFFRAHQSIWQRMQNLGLTEWSYLESFSRKMFWIARMCGERNLLREADEALTMAEEMVATRRASRELRLFRRMTRVLGWRATVRLSEGVRSLTKRYFGRRATHEVDA